MCEEGVGILGIPFLVKHAYGPDLDCHSGVVGSTSAHL